MTATIFRTDSASRTTTSGAEVLLGLLRDALSVAAEQDLDRLHSGATAGKALVALSALAREAAGALGADPGVRLTAGPGVVVLRELAAATRLLDRAAPRSAGDGFPRDLGILVATAKGVHARLLEAVAPAGRRPRTPG